MAEVFRATATSPDSDHSEPAPAAAPTRPDNVPEKFWDAEAGQVNTDALLQSYTHLEQKHSGTAETTPSTAAPDSTSIPTPEVQSDAVTSEFVTPEELKGFYDEYAANGGALTEESYATLKARGASKELVDSYIAGQQARASQFDASIYSSVGGEEQYGEMIGWAQQNLSPAETAAFNEAVQSLDLGRASIAVAGLQAKFQADAGVTGNRISGDGGTGSGDVYHDWAEATLDMRSPEYKQSHAYREKVKAKMARSNL